MRCAVFSCLGLGDGLLALVLSHNLQINGWEVTTYHPTLAQMQDWFPSLPIRPFPEEKNLKGALESFEHFFLFFEKSSWMQKILNFCQIYYPARLKILNPIASCHQDYPYWAEGEFRGDLPLLHNLQQYLKKLNLKNISPDNGIRPLSGLEHKKHPHRILLHPTSSRQGKNWLFNKYFKLQKKLQEEGKEAVFIATVKEQRQLGIQAPVFQTLSDLARYVYESSFFIGNDSGIGHLASVLGLQTMTICRHPKVGNFWRPAWHSNTLITPPSWIPNFKGMRLRDRFWSRWISVKRVWKAYKKWHRYSDLKQH
jgi:heptosyltransferase III